MCKGCRIWGKRTRFGRGNSGILPEKCSSSAGSSKGPVILFRPFRHENLWNSFVAKFNVIGIGFGRIQEFLKAEFEVQKQLFDVDPLVTRRIRSQVLAGRFVKFPGPPEIAVPEMK